MNHGQVATRPVNVPGYVGLGMVAFASLFSPTGFCGLPLLVLVPMGFGGLIVCAIALVQRPRWPAVTGLSIGLATLLFWGLFFASGLLSMHRASSKLGLTISQHTHLQMAAVSLSDEGERQRAADGTASASFDFAKLDPSVRTDPWGRAYRYTATNTLRGFTFFSDGADGIPGTQDDVDLFTIQDSLSFELAPIHPAAKPPPMDPANP